MKFTKEEFDAEINICINSDKLSPNGELLLKQMGRNIAKTYKYMDRNMHEQCFESGYNQMLSLLNEYGKSPFLTDESHFDTFVSMFKFGSSNKFAELKRKNETNKSN